MTFALAQADVAAHREAGEGAVVDLRSPGGLEVTYELAVLEELQAVFSPAMAYAAYVPFYCLIGEASGVPMPRYPSQFGYRYRYQSSHALLPPKQSRLKPFHLQGGLANAVSHGLV